MKLSSRVATLGSALFAAIHTAAASSHAHVLLLDSPPERASFVVKHDETIDPAIARLIFAERLSLSEFYDIPDAKEDTLRTLNAFSGASSQLVLGGSKRDFHSRILIVVDSVENTVDLVPSSSRADLLVINPAPHPSQNARLMRNFIDTATPISSSQNAKSNVEDALYNLAQLKDNDLAHLDRRYFFHIRSLAAIADEEGPSSTQYQNHVTLIQQTIDSLANLASTEPVIATILLAPLQKHCAKSSSDSWNLNVIPHPGTKITRQVAEAPLSEPVAGNAQAKPSNTRVRLEQTATSGISATSVLSGPIPTCFASKSACESGTNNCTGHGECLLKFREKQGDRDSECYGCMCTKPEIRKNKDGSQKTTYFGGSACQKKDLTIPFWLLTGVTVVIVFIISWGIGLLYSMGNEELPSVIGAGVSGPRAK